MEDKNNLQSENILKQENAPQPVEKAFYFVISRNAGLTFFRLHILNDKIIRQFPDFRRFTGTQRELLREFILQKKAFDSTCGFDYGVYDEYTLINPSEKLLHLTLNAGLLRNEQSEIMQRAEGIYKCVLYVKDLNTTLMLSNLIEYTEKITDFCILSPFLAMKGNTVYFIDNLGSDWAKKDNANVPCIEKRFTYLFLSELFSYFANMEIVYEGWTIKQAKPVTALPALLFAEIDSDSYLHVKPLNILRNFPHDFLENKNITTAVEINEDDKTLTVTEIVFPETSPKNTFSAMITANKEKARNSVYEENGYFVIAPDFARKFFGAYIIDLSKTFTLLGSKILAGYKLIFSKPRIRFSMGKGIDYLSGKAEVEIDGKIFSLLSFMEEYKKNAFVMLDDERKAFPDKRIMKRLEKLVSQIEGTDEVTFSYYDIPLLLQETDIELEGKAWEEARSFFTEYNTITERKVNISLANATLRPYQEYGVRWLDYLREYNMGACLADEMGLGKTVQVIALLDHLYKNGKEGKCLILCPKTLIFNWIAELNRFAPNLPYTVHYGSERNTLAMLGSNFRVILSTYATLRHDIADFQRLHFFYIILDESQNIKNLNTQTSSAVLSLRTKHKIAMSGTPFENNLGELYSLFRFLNPVFFGSEKTFKSRYLNPIHDKEDDTALQDLRSKIYPFMLRRLKQDVLKDLPPKTEETVYIELEEAHRILYHRKRKEYKEFIEKIMGSDEYPKSPFIIFKALTELRRLASVPNTDAHYTGGSAKLDYLKEKVSELAENGHKCLVFTNFLSQAKFISRDLSDMGIKNLLMTGLTRNRQAVVKRFQSDSNVKVFIITLKTGGTGLNLTAADYIFLVDPWWNSASELQAIDRSHRIGQEKPVFCYKLIAKDTIEERIMELQKRKTALAVALLKSDDGFLKSISLEDIEYLVSGL